jgi:hypothetical protein
MENLSSLNQRLDEYLNDDISKITLIKNGSQVLFSKAELKHRILLARKAFLDAGSKKRRLGHFSN